MNRSSCALLLFVGVASALRCGTAPTMRHRAAVRMQQDLQQKAETSSTAVVGKVVSTATPGWQQVVQNARARAAAVKADQDATVGAMAVGTTLIFLLPLIDNAFADLIFSALLGGGLFGFLAGFREDALGDGARKIGSTVAEASNTVGEKLDETGVTKMIKDKLPGGGGEGLSMADIKKFGVAGTLAYILTELAFWIVAFPVASTTFYNTAGHWPDFSDGSDRTAVLAFIFAGANVARLAVPLRFGAAFALAPWVDENIVQKLGMGGSDDDAKP